ncbi:collagen-like protein [Microbacterium arborescens]|uniref:collagen-like protein n=1 Tax=Microbacterium arborescens TaxID=33883 RepID=UPI000DF837D6|nr:collagen-like protein [Microbacterium arborescens]
MSAERATRWWRIGTITVVLLAITLVGAAGAYLAWSNTQIRMQLGVAHDDLVASQENAERLYQQLVEEGVRPEAERPSDVTSGQVGAPGTPGARGPVGPSGTDGKDGDPGPQGEPGAPGIDGANGSDGVAGAKGSDGADGPAGPPGPQGEPGPPGSQGAPGDTGPAGPAGPTCPDGYTPTTTDVLIVGADGTTTPQRAIVCTAPPTQEEGTP